MSAPVPILIIAYTFPPYKGIGGRRWAKFAKSLAHRGHQVHVIHSAGGTDLLGSLWTDDIEHERIHIHPLPQHYPTVLFKRPLQTVLEKLAYRFWMRTMPFLVKGNFFDKTVLWRKQLLGKCAELITQHGIGHVIVSGAPFRSMVHALELKERFGVRLVCDFRDPWTWLHTAYGQSLLSNEAMEFERQCERNVVVGADALISPHPSVIDHLREAYPEQSEKCMRVRHAIDPDELGRPLPRRNEGEFRMIYAGAMYGAEEAEAYFEALLLALKTLKTQGSARSILDLYITGHGTTHYRKRVQEEGMEDVIRFHAPLPAKEIFPRIAAADAVLIFIPSFNKDLLGTKFTEVFHLQVPVIHVGDEGAVSEYIRINNVGTTIPVGRLVEELPRIVTRERVLSINPALDLSAHMLDTITERLVEDVLLDEKRDLRNSRELDTDR